MVAVDPRFPQLLHDLRRQRGLSLRAFARLVNYSHTYLWEIETGRKQPTPVIAGTLDHALDGGGRLAELVTDDVTAADPLSVYRQHLKRSPERRRPARSPGWRAGSTRRSSAAGRH